MDALQAQSERKRVNVMPSNNPRSEPTSIRAVSNLRGASPANIIVFFLYVCCM